MSDIDPTPETPVTLGDRMQWWRGSLDNQMNILTGKVAALAGIVEPQSLETIFSKMEEVRAAVSNLSLTNGYILDVGDKLDVTNGRLLSMLNDTGDGANGYLATLTVRGLLYQILQQLRAASVGVPPDSTGDGGQYGTVVVGALRYATFSPPLQDITVSEDGITLYQQNSWQGYSVYVQTPAPYVYIAGAPRTPNTWVDLSGSDIALTFAVDMPSPLNVYLKFPLVRTYTWGPSGLDFIAFYNGSNEPRKVANGAKYNIPGALQPEGWTELNGDWSGYSVVFQGGGLYGGQVGYGAGSIQHFTGGLTSFTVPDGTDRLVLLFIVPFAQDQVVILSPPGL